MSEQNAHATEKKPELGPQPVVVQDEPAFQDKTLSKGLMVKLLIFSAIVGFVMANLHIHPLDLLHWLQMRVQGLLDMGFDAVIAVAKYVFYGAVVVVPIWAIAHLIKRASSVR